MLSIPGHKPPPNWMVKASQGISPHQSE